MKQVAPAIVAVTVLLAGDPLIAQEAVMVATPSLPPAGAAYRGSAAHLFFDGRVRLTCGSHGNFTTAAAAPTAIGTSVLSEYVARFIGELVLEPPLAATATTHRLSVAAPMAERITLAESRAGTQSFDTELVALELRGAGMPGRVMVRESPSRRSTGRTTITEASRGRYRVQSFFDVWLDISIDGGRSWHSASAPVRMNLAPSQRATR